MAVALSDCWKSIDELLPETSNVERPTSNVELPVALAIIGRPNAGKSSLINSILKDQRTIVSEIAGTTRDAVDIPYERGGQKFLLIDTAGMRARSKHSTSVEVFSVMRAERTIRRADLCVLVIDVTSGVTSQDKKIAGLIQESRKPSLVILNKWDLVKPPRGHKTAMKELVAAARDHLFFLDYAPVLIASAATGENVVQLFDLIADVQRASECPHWHRHSQSRAPRGVRRKPAADDRHPPAQALLRRAIERRRRARNRSAEVHPLRQSAEAAERRLRSLHRRPHPRGRAVSRVCPSC